MAWEMISSGKGSHFDPIIIESLARHFDSFRGLYEKLKTV
jgi:response regulator RpfG family c-di-GMP phosphodiesterase